MLKNWHYLNYKKHFYLHVQQKRNAFFGRLRMILEVAGGFAELKHVITVHRAMQ